jgi:hypothetical protein
MFGRHFHRHFPSSVSLAVFSAALIFPSFIASAASAGSSTVSINPTQGPAGTRVTGTGSNWPPGDQMEVSWADTGAVLADTTVNSAGGFSVPFSIPSNASQGPHTIYFTDLTSRFFLPATFTVGPAQPPPLQMPFPRGTHISIGPLGLHDNNFASILDDRTGKVYTFSGNRAPVSLDFVLQPPATGTATIPTTSLRTGVVLAVWKACQVVLIDHGGGLWGIYLHQAKIAVTSGNKVSGDTVIGYSTTVKPSGGASCGKVTSDAEHVHVALLKGAGQKGSYITLLGQSLCGHKVVRLNQDNTDIILQGLTQTQGQQFSVPC